MAFGLFDAALVKRQKWNRALFEKKDKSQIQQMAKANALVNIIMEYVDIMRDMRLWMDCAMKVDASKKTTNLASSRNLQVSFRSFCSRINSICSIT